jgi:pilus assembly protein CpaC
MRNHCLVRGRLNLIGLVLFFCYLLAANDSAAQQQATPTITVTINKSMVFRLAEKAKRVSVSQPAVADVLVVAPSQLLINGKAIGTTTLIIFDEKGDVTNYDLVVAPDIAALRSQLRSVFPNEKVEISTSGPSLVLRGEVSNEVVYDRVLELVISYLPPKPPQQVAPATSQSVQFGASPIATISSSGLGFAGGGSLAFTEEKSITDPYRWNDKKDIDGIIDMLIIREIRQIELDVTVADVRLDKAREVGFNFQYTGPTDVQSATSLLGPGGTGVVGALSGAFTYVNGAYTLTSLYRMLQNRNIASILAQPRLVVKNGKSGGFLSGGEVPIVTVTANTFGVIFKPFGVRLDFLPTLTQSDRIDLRVFPEVSAIGSNTFAGVPDFIVRRSISRVELKEGESLILGGLLDQQVVKSMAKIPYLGDVPILGALFRSTSFQNRESELIFVITPRIVRTMKAGEVPKLPSIEKFDHEDMRQVPVPGTSDTKKPMGGASIP